MSLADITAPAGQVGVPGGHPETAGQSQALPPGEDWLERAMKQNPRRAAEILESNPAAFAAQMPSLLSRYCDEHPSFMGAWLQNRQATIQKYLDANPALLWNHLRAHPSFRVGGQAWDRQFTMTLVIEIPENQEHLVREPIQWVLPKDPERRKAKLREMAARGEHQVAVRGSAAGQAFIDGDRCIEESELFKLSENDRKYLEGDNNVTKSEKLRWFKGRMQYSADDSTARHDLLAEKHSQVPKIGPYQRAKHEVFRELHPILGSQSSSAQGHKRLNESASDTTDSDDESSDSSNSSDGYNESLDNDSDSDNEGPSAGPPHQDLNESDDGRSDYSPNSKTSDTDSDTPLIQRKRRHNQPDLRDDSSNASTDSSESDADDFVPPYPRWLSATKPSFGPAAPGMKWIRKDFGGKTIPMEVPIDEPESTTSDRSNCHIASNTDTSYSSDDATDTDSLIDASYIAEESAEASSVIDNSRHDQLESIPERALVEYPAPSEMIKASQTQKMTGKWRIFEEDLAIGHMLDIRDEGNITGEQRFRETSRRLHNINGIPRTWGAVKNFWNRTGRARSGFDERKNKKAPLATSQQGKNASSQREMAQTARDEQLARSTSLLSDDSYTESSEYADDDSESSSSQRHSPKRMCLQRVNLS